jgi:deazaflavin-dependent oxidoreductase (nitroreductase family)
MTDFDNPTDPPSGFAREHLQRYVASGGANGHEFHGANTLLLTTKGRRSGQARRTPLIYGRDGDRYVVVASKGGADVAPEWYRNLAADPHVRVQVQDKVFDANARTAGPAEKPALWNLMAGIFPSYNEYQTKTSREIPVVILEPVTSTA